MNSAVFVDQELEGRLLGTCRFDPRQHQRVRIGTMPGAGIRLRDAAASRLQAVLEMQPGRVVLHDVGGMATLRLNGEAVRPGSVIELTSGDIVDIGVTRLKFRWDSGRELTPPPSTPTGVSSDLQIDVEPLVEKYDTRHLVRAMAREQRRSRAVVMVMVLGGGLLFAATVMHLGGL